MKTLIKKINAAPQQSGCYLYKNDSGRIIYVGKAKNIRNRVRQYFQPSTILENTKLQALVHSIVDVEYRITDTELNALLLEYQLIKQYKPWFNSQFKRDVQPTQIRIAIEDALPTITVVTKSESPKSEYMDCFSNADRAEEAIQLMNAVWKTPVCQKKSFDKPSRACLRYDLNKCLAPCVQGVDRSLYKETIHELVRFFKGKKTTVIPRLDKKMDIYAKELNFEKAAITKQNIDNLMYLQTKHKRRSHFSSKRDVILFIRAYHSPEISLFYIKEGLILGRIDVLDKFNPHDVTQVLLDIQKSKETIFSDGLLNGLADIIADKMFVVLPIKTNKESIAKKIERGYLDFTNNNQ